MSGFFQEYQKRLDPSVCPYYVDILNDKEYENKRLTRPVTKSSFPLIYIYKDFFISKSYNLIMYKVSLKKLSILVTNLHQVPYQTRYKQMVLNCLKKEQITTPFLIPLYIFTFHLLDVSLCVSSIHPYIVTSRRPFDPLPPSTPSFRKF